MKLHDFTCATLISLIMGLCFGVSAWAGTTTITGENGKSGTVETNRTKDGNTVNIDRTTTFPAGKTSTSTGSFTGTGNGNYTGNVDRTNRQGETNGYEISGQRNRNNGTVTNSGTITNENGKQATFDRSGTCNSGSCTGYRSVTYPGGKTRNTTLSGQRTGKGEFSGTANVTGRNGRTRSGTFVRSR
jgi:hypothetical protein